MGDPLFCSFFIVLAKKDAFCFVGSEKKSYLCSAFEERAFRIE